MCNEDEAAVLGVSAKQPMNGAVLTVIKQGPLPVIAVQHDGTTTEVAVTPVANIVDTTGAGDAFTAALTVGLVGGMEPQAALEQACVVGALATTKMGAQSSPTLIEVQQLK